MHDERADIQRALRDTIGDALHRSVRKRPHKQAIAFAHRSWTYAELDAAANKVAGELLGRGLARGDRVAVFGRNSDVYVIAWLACVRAGLVHVPVNYMLKDRELLYILQQSGSRALFHDADLAAPAEAVREESGVEIEAPLDDLLAAALDPHADDREPALELDGDDVVQLLYTSGTTSAPKGAMMTHRALLAEYLSCIVDIDVSRDDRALHALPLYHSAQMHAGLMPFLLMGATNLIVSAPAPDICLPLIERQRITWMFAPPTVWINFLRSPEFERYDLSYLRKVLYGASIMPGPVLEELRRRLPSAGFYNAYGQSEIAPVATILRPEEHDERPASAGRPVLHVETRVVDEEMQDLAPGELGEIVHRSPQLLLGYWNKPEETEEAFRGGWFHSGDLGYLDEEGYLYVVDRVKDVINTGGVLVAGREVEEALYTHPAVSEVAVIALPDPKWVEAVTAVVVLKPGGTAAAEDLITHARQQLAAFKVPKRVIFVSDLPRNASGKILKRDLRARFAAGDDPPT